MCTVTYIPCKDSIFLTSNRDEKNWRKPAIPPAILNLGSGSILHPKDADAGGTWIAGHENGNAVIFLNGGVQAHTPQPPYRKSRGLILLDLIDHSTPYNCFLAVNLNNIEPFTAIIRDNTHLFECRWDGEHKHHIELDGNTNYIWSSVTLYSNEVIAKRKKWFEEWIGKNPAPSQEDIFHFHQFTGDGDSNNDLLMNRNGQVFTVSVTSIEIKPDLMKMDYIDLQNKERFSEQIFSGSLMPGH